MSKPPSIDANEPEPWQCPCGEPVEHWELADHDQWHPPFPPPGRLGEEIAINVRHAGDVWHRVEHGRVI